MGRWRRPAPPLCASSAFWGRAVEILWQKIAEMYDFRGWNLLGSQNTEFCTIFSSASRKRDASYGKTAGQRACLLLRMRIPFEKSYKSRKNGQRKPENGRNHTKVQFFGHCDRGISKRRPRPNEKAASESLGCGLLVVRDGRGYAAGAAMLPARLDAGGEGKDRLEEVPVDLQVERAALQFGEAARDREA